MRFECGDRMAVERKFINEAMLKYEITKFLEKELDRAWLSSVEIQNTPIVTRIAVEVTRPGKVIGRKGRTIQLLTETIKQKFNIENPQIIVIESGNPYLKPRLVARIACRMIERGKNVRAVLHNLLKEIMNAGALGAEIVASGKIFGKGGRARSIRVSAGYLPKAGEPSRLVLKDHYTAYPKSGAIGVRVSIVPPGVTFPDKEIKPVALPKVISSAEGIKRKSV